MAPAFLYQSSWPNFLKKETSPWFHTRLTVFDTLPCCSCPSWTWLDPVGLKPEQTVTQTLPSSPMTETAWENTK